MSTVLRDHTYHADLATQRHYYRCRVCLSVISAEGAPWVHRDTIRCAACEATSWDYMGRVERARLKVDRARPACDDRCMGARGPSCDCQCGGKNHGAGLLVVVTTEDVGEVPSVTPPGGLGRARAIADEWRTAEVAAHQAITARYGAVLRAKLRGEWIERWGDYLAGEQLIRALNEARRMTSQRGRLDKLAGIHAALASGGEKVAS